jgi:hypothetical protein
MKPQVTGRSGGLSRDLSGRSGESSAYCIGSTDGRLPHARIEADSLVGH